MLAAAVELDDLRRLVCTTGISLVMTPIQIDHPVDLRRDRRDLADPAGRDRGDSAPAEHSSRAIRPVITQPIRRWSRRSCPAKDEELNLADCLDSVCRQTYPNLEILVVDDRSTDRTGEIARGFAVRDPRVRVLSIEHLPPGWTGKTHALDQALPTRRAASGSGSSTPTPSTRPRACRS